MGSYALMNNMNLAVPAAAKSPAPSSEGTTSPAPEGAYRYNPYDSATSRYEMPAQQEQEQQYAQYNNQNSYPMYNEPQYDAAAQYTHTEQAHTAVPAPVPSVLHTQLSGCVNFVPYPNECYPVPECTVPRESLVRIFIGQLPYRVTPMQLAWLCDTIAPGVQLYHVETIMKKTGMKGKRLPTGCVHALARPEDVDYLINCLSFRVLFDDTGIWCSQSPEEQEQLQSYCNAMKHNEQMRFRDRPYQPVVVQFATSHYGSSNTRRGNNTPPQRMSHTPPVSPPAAAYNQPSWGHGYNNAYSPAAAGQQW